MGQGREREGCLRSLGALGALTLLALAALVGAAAAQETADAQVEIPDAGPPPEPATGGALSVTAEPPTLTLGIDREARIAIDVVPDSGPVEVYAALGSIAEIEPSGEGIYTAVYSPPDQFIPQVDVVAAAALVGGELVWGFAAVQLIGQGEAVIETRKYANAVIHIRDRVFGPVQANKKGKARIAVQVPPGTTHGYDGEGQAVDLEVPPTPRTRIFAVADEVSLDNPAPIPLCIVAVAADGSLDADAEVTVDTDLGEIVDLRAIGDGAFAAIYRPPAEVAGPAELRAAAVGDHHPPGTLTIEVLPKALIEEEELPPPPPPPPPPPTAVPWLNAAPKAGFAWNFGSMRTFDVALDIGVRLPLLDGRLGLGVEAGFSYFGGEATSSAGTGQRYELSSATWIVPLSGVLWFRQPLTKSWAIVVSGHGAGVLVDNTLQLGGGAGEEHERGFHPGAGGGWALERELGTGAVLLEVRYLWIGGTSETVKGSLSTLFVNLGYRLFFL